MTKKVLSFGNALVDIITQLDTDKYLSDLNLPKGSMQLVDSEVSKKVQDATSHLESKITTGGSAANTSNGIANLGVKSGYIGKVGNDKLGDFYIQDMQENGIEPRFFKSESSPTGCAVALISKDGERTFATYLGAAVEMGAEELKKELFEGYDYFHIEGYLVQNHDLVRKAITLAKEVGLKVSIDLASYNVVEENLDFLKEMCKNVDIIFANEEEAKAFTGKEPEEALEEIAKISEIAVVKIGKKGSLIKSGEKAYKINPNDKPCLDTTGAGDMYAAGFLAGLCNVYDLEKCGKMGDILASNVIGVYGAKMDAENWNEIRKEISTL